MVRATATVTIADLPNELLLEIASHLSFSSLLALKNVSTKWRSIVSAAHLDPPTRWLLSIYNTVLQGPALERTPAQIPKLTNADRARYISAIDNCVNRLHTPPSSSSSPHARFASSVFRTWIHEWPSHASVNDLSPASLVSAFFDRASYHKLDGALVYFPNKRVLFAMTAMLKQVVLTRVPLVCTEMGRGKRTVRCEPLGMMSVESGGDWARFLPLFTPRKNGDDKTRYRCGGEEHVVPLYVFSGNGIGEDLAGCIVTVDAEGCITSKVDDWGQFLLQELFAMRLHGQARENTGAVSFPEEKNETRTTISCRSWASAEAVPVQPLPDKPHPSRTAQKRQYRQLRYSADGKRASTDVVNPSSMTKPTHRIVDEAAFALFIGLLYFSLRAMLCAAANARWVFAAAS